LVDTLLGVSSSLHPNFEEGELIFGLIVSNTTDPSTECASGIAEWGIDINTEEIDEKGKRPAINIPESLKKVETVIIPKDAINYDDRVQQLSKSVKNSNKKQKENADKLFVKMSELANSVESVANAQKEAAITTQSNDIVLNSQLVIDQKLDKKNFGSFI